MPADSGAQQLNGQMRQELRLVAVAGPAFVEIWGAVNELRQLARLILEFEAEAVMALVGPPPANSAPHTHIRMLRVRCEADQPLEVLRAEGRLDISGGQNALRALADVILTVVQTAEELGDTPIRPHIHLGSLGVDQTGGSSLPLVVSAEIPHT
jgi:hypothetical protein